MPGLLRELTLACEAQPTYTRPMTKRMMLAVSLGVALLGAYVYGQEFGKDTRRLPVRHHAPKPRR